MSSAAQATANLANAQHSTGPRTVQGKSASSKNAMKHGFTAQTVLLPDEDEAAYRKMCAGMFEDFGPAGEPERNLVQLLCDTQWRLHRCSRVEAEILTDDILNYKGLDILSRHEARLKKQYSTTLKEATDLIEGRRRAEDAAMKEASIVRRADKLNGTNRLAEIGFDLPTAPIDAVINREDILADAGATLEQARLDKLMSQPWGTPTPVQR